MKEKKNTGSYYSPNYLSRFIMGYVAVHFKKLSHLSIFEPSVGDGSFVKAYNETTFPKNIKSFTFTAIDKIKPELRKAQALALANKKANSKYSFTKSDFLKFQIGLKRKFNLVVGNPPYISKRLLNKTQIGLCEEIHDSAQLSEKSVKNIWSSFLVRCCQFLTADGVLAFILPAELLQVKYTQELRVFLLNQFKRTEIFTFSELLFDCKGQDTVLFVGFKEHLEQGQFYTHISNIDQLEKNDFALAENYALAGGNIKWSHHILSADDLQFVRNIGQKLNKIDQYCESKPGIVTAANDFFIVNEETEIKYHLSKYLKPIIQKGIYVNGGVVFDDADFEGLVTDGKPAKVLVFNDEDSDYLPSRVKNYLEIGVLLELPNRYKCSKRKNWFVIPNIATAPKGFFFRRVYRYPKLLKNDANILVTDSAYKIQMRQGYDIDNLIYSFYNSLTLLFAEMEGRYYGGGVLELTPQEFKNLPIPYIPVTSGSFHAFAKEFKGKARIEDILNSYDFKILNTSLKLSTEEILKIRAIYGKLVSKRFRRSVDL